MKIEFAEKLAVDILGWIVGHEVLLPVFLGSTGATLNSLKADIGQPEQLISVLEFLMLDDKWIIEFCESCNYDPNELNLALQVLAGSKNPHWT